jgi:hypothetical protein
VVVLRMTDQPDLIERLFDAPTVVGFAGLFACMEWMLLSRSSPAKNEVPVAGSRQTAEGRPESTILWRRITKIRR